VYAYDGRLILNEKRPLVEFGARSLNGHRGEIHKILYDFALSLGIEIRNKSNVSEVSLAYFFFRDDSHDAVQYWETETEAGVICNGEKLTADIVVCSISDKCRKPQPTY